MKPTYAYEILATTTWEDTPTRFMLLGGRAEQQLFFLTSKNLGNGETKIFYVEGFSLEINVAQAQEKAIALEPAPNLGQT